jgi:hypothetical protein
MVEIMCARPTALERLDIINLTTLYTSIVILVNEERLDDDENFVDVWMDEIIEFVEDTINDLDKQVVLLVLESTLHKQGEDLAKERPAPHSRASGKTPGLYSPI